MRRSERTPFPDKGLRPPYALHALRAALLLVWTTALATGCGTVMQGVATGFTTPTFRSAEAPEIPEIEPIPEPLTTSLDSAPPRVDVAWTGQTNLVGPRATLGIAVQDAALQGPAREVLHLVVRARPGQVLDLLSLPQALREAVLESGGLSTRWAYTNGDPLPPILWRHINVDFVVVVESIVRHTTPVVIPVSANFSAQDLRDYEAAHQAWLEWATNTQSRLREERAALERRLQRGGAELPQERRDELRDWIASLRQVDEEIDSTRRRLVPPSEYTPLLQGERSSEVAVPSATIRVHVINASTGRTHALGSVTALAPSGDPLLLAATRLVEQLGL